MIRVLAVFTVLPIGVISIARTLQYTALRILSARALIAKLRVRFVQSG